MFSQFTISNLYFSGSWICSNRSRPAVVAVGSEFALDFFTASGSGSELALDFNASDSGLELALDFFNASGLGSELALDFFSAFVPGSELWTSPSWVRVQSSHWTSSMCLVRVWLSLSSSSSPNTQLLGRLPRAASISFAPSSRRLLGFSSFDMPLRPVTKLWLDGRAMVVALPLH